MRYFFTKFLLLIAMTLTMNAENEISFDWKSANNWEGGEFKVPTWFAEDMKVSGYEVLHFHDGYYDSSSVGHWSYAFALIIMTGIRESLEEADIPEMFT